MEIRCHRISGGKATGPALVTKEPISFLGTVDPETGEVVDPGHQLYGSNLGGKVLIFPGGKGSTVGSYVIYQLKKRGVAPSAPSSAGSPWWTGWPPASSIWEMGSRSPSTPMGRW